MRALIVAPAWVGDMVMAGPLVAEVGRTHREVHVLAPPSTAPVAERLPGVKQVHELAVGHGGLQWPVRRRVGRALRSLDFQTAYVLPNTFKSALVPWVARIPRRVGYRGEQRYGVLNDMRRLDPRAVPRLVDRYLQLAVAEDAPRTVEVLPHLEVDETNLAALKKRYDLGDEPVVCLCPGAEFGPAKRWPAVHFAAVARRCIDAGRQVWLLGARTDSECCGEIAAAVDGVADLSGQTRLQDAIDLLSVADAVVCNDSGLMHVAAALDRRVVALFGSTSAEFTPPLGAHSVVLQTSISCRPCFQRVCPLGHLRCLTELGPDAVMEQLAERRAG